MSKLMIAALAVASMSAFAADFDESKLAAAEKVQLTLKKVNTEAGKVETVKYNGFVFWDELGNTKVVTWDLGDKVDTKDEKWPFPGKSKETKVTQQLFKTVFLGDYAAEVEPGETKVGKSISFGKDYLGYGSGSAALTVDMVSGKVKAKESISGNMVNQAEKEYGTWRISYDSSSTKLIKDKGYSIKDILVKNKVEYWD